MCSGAALSKETSGLWGAITKTRSSANNLGSLLQAQGKLSLAEPFLRRALEGYVQTLGRDHPEHVSSANTLRALLKAMAKEE